MATRPWREIRQPLSPEREAQIQAGIGAELSRMKLPELRKARKLTQRTVADILGIAQGDVSKLEARATRNGLLAVQGSLFALRGAYISDRPTRGMEERRCLQRGARMERDEVLRRLGLAKTTFLERYGRLLDVAAHERTMTAHLSTCVERDFPEWNVDCEYDMNGEIRKRLRWPHGDDRPKLVIPDIIVHRQGTHCNLLVIEAKKSGTNNAIDRAKVASFMAASEYRYEHAALVVFVTGSCPRVDIELLERPL